MKAVLQDMWVNSCQITDHFLGWDRLPLHRSRYHSHGCWYCANTNTNPHPQPVRKLKKMDIITASFPTDAEYEQMKTSESAYHTKRCIWIGSSYQQNVPYVKEWLFTLNRVNYKVTNCRELGHLEPVVPCKQLIVFHCDNDQPMWTRDVLLKHTRAAKRALVIVSKSWFDLERPQETNVIWFVISDLSQLRQFHLILLKSMDRCTVRQYLQKSTLSNIHCDIHCDPHLLDANLLI